MKTRDYKNTIGVIGFDLDQTLYPKSPDIDQAIQYYIYKKIAEKKKCTLRNAQKQFADIYQNGRGLSGRKTLIELGIPDAADIVQEALERANIASTLKPDKKINKMLQQLNKRYHALDLITGADWNDTMKKLTALAIPENIFSHIITADVASKSNSNAYHYWINYYKHLKPCQFLYIGDRIKSDYEIPSELGIHAILVNISNPDPALDIPQLRSLAEIRDYLL